MGFLNDMQGALGGMKGALKSAVGLGNSPQNGSTSSVPEMPPATPNNKKSNLTPSMSSSSTSTISSNSNSNSVPMLKGGRKRKSSRKTKKRSKRSKTSRRRN